MKKKNLLEILKSGSFNVPLYLYKLKDNFKIDADTFMFLMYLMSLGNIYLFNPKEISEKTGLELLKVMEYISILSDNKLLSVDVIKNEKGLMEEYINLDLFYEKVNNILVEEINNEKESIKDIFEIIENEIGRILSPMEIQIVQAWIDTGYSESIIKEAFKEAVMNGVTSLRYIDKILYEWSKKGIKTKKDVEENKRQFNMSKENNKIKKEVKTDDFDYFDKWLDDNDEE